MAAARMHLNGVTYDLARPLDEVAVARLAEALRPGDRFATPVVHDVDVVVDGRVATLRVRTDLVWASAVWSVQDRGGPDVSV